MADDAVQCVTAPGHRLLSFSTALHADCKEPLAILLQVAERCHHDHVGSLRVLPTSIAECSCLSDHLVAGRALPTKEVSIYRVPHALGTGRYSVNHLGGHPRHFAQPQLDVPTSKAEHTIQSWHDDLVDVVCGVQTMLPIAITNRPRCDTHIGELGSWGPANHHVR